MKRRIERYIIDLIILLEAAVLASTVFISTSVAMFFLAIVIFFSFLLGFILFLYTPIYAPSNRKSLFFYLLTIISVLIYSISSRDDLKSTFIFISGIMLLYYLYTKGLDRKNINLLIICSVFLILIFLLTSNYSSNFDKRNYFTSVWENANMSGIAITSALLPIIIGVFFVKTKTFKIFLFLISFVGVYLLFLTFNRSSIMSLIVFAFLVFYNRNKYRFNNIYRILIIITPVIIVFFFINYIIFYGDVLFLGKSIAQRPGWPLLIASIIKNPLDTYRLTSGGLNLFIAGIIEFGIIGMIFYVLLVIYMKPKERPYTKIQYLQVAYFAFLALFIQQSFENTIIDGAFGIYIYSYMLLGIANSNFAVKLCSHKNQKFFKT